ncbi:hypothetical protein G7013_23090 [Pseudomonas viridiflava]|uniref:hypothetical protein n=1 Tax=Pseudomonas viridiflava TaxID=33069 RepID=UPI0015E44231|nr:hypothetical protein [Pseudomonas viridiflava]MBA1232538.1 hypothetical protein [Pseudomonas viridiflava]
MNIAAPGEIRPWFLKKLRDMDYIFVEVEPIYVNIVAVVFMAEHFSSVDRLASKTGWRTASVLIAGVGRGKGEMRPVNAGGALPALVKRLRRVLLREA